MTGLICTCHTTKSTPRETRWKASCALKFIKTVHQKAQLAAWKYHLRYLATAAVFSSRLQRPLLNSPAFDNSVAFRRPWTLPQTSPFHYVKTAWLKPHAVQCTEEISTEQHLGWSITTGKHFHSSLNKYAEAAERKVPGGYAHKAQMKQHSID